MSIIQDALKRKEEEERQGLRLRDDGKVEPSPPPPDTPPDVPVDAPVKPTGGGGDKPPWKAVILALIILLAALVAVYFLVVNGLKAFREPSAPATEQVAPETAVETDDPETEEPDGIVGELKDDEDEYLAPETEPEEPQPESEPPEPDLDIEQQHEADDENSEETYEEDSAEQPEEDDLPAEVIPEEPVAVVDWPRIHVSGIMASRTGSDGSVLIDSTLLTVGDTHKGVRIKSISERSVVLEYEGDVKTLSTGQIIGD